MAEPQKSVVQSLIDNTLDKALSEGAVLLTANRRQSRAFLATYNRLRLAEGKKAWETPQIVPFDTYLETLFKELNALQLCSAQLMTDAEELHIWKSIVSGIPATELLSTSSTAKIVSQSWKIEQSFDIRIDADEHYLNQDQRYYRQWSQKFRQLKLERNLVDNASLVDVLVSLLPQAGSLLPASFILTGFLELSPQQEQFLSVLGDLGVAIVRDYNPPELSGDVCRTSASSPNNELRMAAQWVKDQLYHTSGYIGVVVPDLHLRRTEVLRVFDTTFFPAATPSDIVQHGRPYDVSLGLPLHRYPSVDAALLILRMTFNRLRGDEITRFVLSPYVAGNLDERDARSRLDAKLRGEGHRAINPRELSGMCNESTPQLQEVLDKLNQLQSTSAAVPSVWLNRYVNALRVAGWPGEDVSSEEHQAVEAWRNVVEPIGRFDALTGKLYPDQMFGLLADITAERVFQPQTEDVRIQILGALEGHGLLYEALWVTGMDNESWPPPQRASAFLPLTLQGEKAVPGASVTEDLERAKKLVSTWSSSAPTVVFSHPTLKDGNNIVAAKQISGFEQQEILALTDGEPVLPMSKIHALVEHEEIPDFSGPAINRDKEVRGGARLFEDQASCPFKAFVTHRLGVKPLEDPELGLGPREKGIVFHNAVDFFWRDVGTHEGLVAFSEEALRKKILDCVDEAMESVSHESSQLLDLERKRVQVLIYEWLATHEVNRAPFEVLAREKNVSVEFETLKLSLQVDRLDQLADGGILIVDYKTGANNPIKSWHELRITKAQLPLYAVASADVQVVGICFAQVARGQQKFKGVAEVKGLLKGLEGPDRACENWSNQIVSWQERLQLLAGEIREGLATVTPTSSACAHCSLTGLCRIEQDTIEQAVVAEESVS